MSTDASPPPRGGTVAAWRDDRWVHGMNGWRIFVVPLAVGRAEYGEVTGYSHDGDRVWVVVDGEEYPRVYRWDEVRPA